MTGKQTKDSRQIFEEFELERAEIKREYEEKLREARHKRDVALVKALKNKFKGDHNGR